MAVPYFQVSRDASRALEEFSDEFRQALTLGEFSVWASELGLLRNSNALRTTWPIPLDAAGYKELKGDIKFRALYHRSMTMKSKQWTDGVEAPAIEIEAPDFIGWNDQPSNIANEWMRLPNEMVATMLESGSGNGPLLDLYRDPDTDTASARRLFASDHPYNVLAPDLGTFDNDKTATLAEVQSGKFFEDISDYFRGIKGPNGKPLGLRMAGGTFLIPPAKEQLFKKALEQDTLIRNVSSTGTIDVTSSVVAAVTQNNIHQGTMKYIVADELTSTGVVYAIAAGKPGLVPWVVQQGEAPEEIVHDRDSDYYKRTLNLAVAYVGQANAAAAMPHAIAKVTLS